MLELKPRRASWGAAWRTNCVRWSEIQPSNDHWNKHSRDRLKLIQMSYLQSITRKSLPFTRRTASLASRRSTPAPASMLLDDGDTPRHILRNILQTGTSSDLTELLPLLSSFPLIGIYLMFQNLWGPLCITRKLRQRSHSHLQPTPALPASVRGEQWVKGILLWEDLKRVRQQSLSLLSVSMTILPKVLLIHKKWLCLSFSVELSTFDLPDLTIGVAASTVKGLSRKRPHRTLDVTAFEKRFQEGDGKLFVLWTRIFNAGVFHRLGCSSAGN